MPLLSDNYQSLNPQERGETHIPPWTILNNPSLSVQLVSPGMSPDQTAQDVSFMNIRPEAPSPPRSARIPPLLQTSSQTTEDYGTYVRPQSQPRPSVTSLSSDEEAYESHSPWIPPQSPERPPSTPEIASLVEAPTPPPFSPIHWDNSSSPPIPSSPIQTGLEVPLLSDTASFMSSSSNDEAGDLSALIDRCDASSFASAPESVRSMPNGRFRLQGWAGAAPEGSTMMSPDGSNSTTNDTAPAGSWLDQCMSVISADEILRERWKHQLENCFSAVYDTLELHELGRRIPGIGSGQSSYSTVPVTLPTERRRRYTVPSAGPSASESETRQSDHSGDTEAGLRATWHFSTDDSAGMMSLMSGRTAVIGRWRY